MWQPPKETEEVQKPRVGEYLRSIPLKVRGPNVIESFGKAFSASLPLVSGPPTSPPVLRHTLADWWARVRTDLGVLPFYNVDWHALAAQAFDLAPLDEMSTWADVEEYARKIALLRETIDVGDLYPPPA